MNVFRRLYWAVYKGLATVSPTRGISTILGIGILLWGSWVFNPYIDTFASNQVYYNLALWASEYLWGALFIIAGISILMGSLRKKIEYIRWGTFMGWMLWLTTSISYAFADPTETFMITNGVLALMHAWIYLQIKLHPETILGNQVVPNEWETEKQLMTRQILEGDLDEV